MRLVALCKETALPPAQRSQPSLIRGANVPGAARRVAEQRAHDNVVWGFRAVRPVERLIRPGSPSSPICNMTEPSCLPTTSGSSSSQQAPQEAAAAAAAGGAGPSSSQQQQHAAVASAAEDSRREYLEQQYGSAVSHTSLTRQEVDAMVDRALADSPTVQYLLQSLKQVGCGVGRPFFHVTRCADEVGGGFSTDYGVILCHNKLSTYREVELALAHELIHAYDFCRASNLDLTDCRHHACTEIRAANLSGDCSLYQEFLRGNLSEALVGQHKRCVKRRALLSVSLNPHCQGGRAEAAVAEMLPRCFKDTDPFPRTPGLQ